MRTSTCTIGEALNSFLSRTGLARSVKEYLVMASWPKVVGEEIASRVRPASILNGVLFVVADNSAWACEISFLKRQIVQRLNELSVQGEIRDIRVEVLQKSPRPDRTKRGETARAREVQVLDESELDKISLPDSQWQEINRMSQRLADPVVADRFSKLLVKAKKSEIWWEKRGWNRCPNCSALKALPRSECPVCRYSLSSYRLLKVKEILMGCPWLKYEDVAREAPGISAEEFEGLKRMLIEEFERKLESAAIGDLGEAEPIGQDSALETYVLLKTGKSPFELSADDVVRALGPKFSTLFLRRGGSRACSST